MSRLVVTAVCLITLAASAAMGHAHEPSAVRTVWAAAEDGAAISPDGKLVAFIAWTTGDIAVRDVSNGSAVRLTVLLFLSQSQVRPATRGNGV